MTRRHLHRRRPASWEQTINIGDEELAVNGTTYLITGTLTVHWVHDPNADCDADGNRGRDVTYEDERAFTLESAERCDADGWPLEQPPLTGDALPADLVKAAEDWAETYDVSREGPDDEDDEPDYDREDDDERRECAMEADYD